MKSRALGTVGAAAGLRLAAAWYHTAAFCTAKSVPRNAPRTAGSVPLAWRYQLPATLLSLAP
eukprot:2402500-Rhodomonas_salina.1